MKGESDFDRFGPVGWGQPETMWRGVKVKLAGNMKPGSWRATVERMGNDDGYWHLDAIANVGEDP